jgi:hypothetical protein
MVKKAGNGIERGDRMQASWTAAFLDPSMCFFLPFFFFYAVLSSTSSVTYRLPLRSKELL